MNNIVKIPGYELSEYLKKYVSVIRKQLLWFLAASMLVHVIPIITNLKFETEVVEKKRPPTSVKFIQRAPRLQKQMDLQNSENC